MQKGGKRFVHLCTGFLKAQIRPRLHALGPMVGIIIVVTTVDIVVYCS